jgi:hypothetical protein
MARKDIVRRTQEAGWRSSSAVPVQVQRGWYDQDMDRLGRNKPSIFPKDHAHGQFETWGDLLSRPLALLTLSILTFGLVFGALVWRDGRLDGLFKTGVEMPAATKSWMQSARKATETAIEEPADSPTGDLPPNEIEAMLDEDRTNLAARRAAAIAATVRPEANTEDPMTSGE